MNAKIFNSIIIVLLIGFSATSLSAETDYEKAIRLSFNEGKWQESIPFYERAAKNDVRCVACWNTYGNALRNVGRVADSYSVFKKAIEIDAAANRSKPGLGDNFEVAVIVGIDDAISRDNLRLAANWADLATSVWSNNQKIAIASHKAYIYNKQFSKANRIESLIGGAIGKLLEGQTLLFQKQDVSAERAFHEAQKLSNNDPEIDESIARAYRVRVEKLPYTEQMNSKDQDKVVSYSTQAVENYFRLHPYDPGTIESPLHDEFCLGQGAGGRSFHYGLNNHYSYDLTRCNTSESAGTPIYAVADGIVESAVYTNKDRPMNAPVDFSAQPNLVILNHGNGLLSKYFHLQRNSGNLKQGDQVKAGQQIGRIGNTGITTGPHLHFMITNKEGITLPFRINNLVFNGQFENQVSTFDQLGRYSLKKQQDVKVSQEILNRDFVVGRWLEESGNWSWTFSDNGQVERMERNLAAGRPLLSLQGKWEIAKNGEFVVVNMGRFKLEFQRKGLQLISEEGVILNKLNQN